jgi:putative DNA methylase
MIERWFPCAEVSETSASGWGSGKSEKNLFTWFAARPLAQAKAAVVTSLLPWPDDEIEQLGLQDLVRRAMTGKDAANAELKAEIEKAHPGGASMLDIFAGRAMIPLEAARLGVRAEAIDYSPVAVLAGQLLADYPLRDWRDEPYLPFSPADAWSLSRLLDDVAGVLRLVGERYIERMQAFYARASDGEFPWGYVWATTLPCQECGRRFPLTGSLTLRFPLPSKKDPGQSYRIEVDRAVGTWQTVVEDGVPSGLATLRVPARAKSRAKSAICPFCDHVHATALHRRLSAEGLREDALMAVAENDEKVGRRFRPPNVDDFASITAAADALATEPPFAPGMPAVPDEAIPPGNTSVIQPSVYGAANYGDLCNTRQTLGFVRLARILSDLGRELVETHGLSHDYAAALIGYGSSVFVRRIKRSTRGTSLNPNLRPNSNRIMLAPLFANEASVAFSYDYFETGLGSGPGTWEGLSADTLTALRNQVTRVPGPPASVSRGSATALPFRDKSLSAVVTDPPYDAMIPYSDASDIFYVWLKRALSSTAPWFSFTAHAAGVQEKTEEAIVKKEGGGDHRTQEHYDSMMQKAFAEARRVITDDGVVTIVFGHGDPRSGTDSSAPSQRRTSCSRARGPRRLSQADQRDRPTLSPR